MVELSPWPQLQTCHALRRYKNEETQEEYGKKIHRCLQECILLYTLSVCKHCAKVLRTEV